MKLPTPPAWVLAKRTILIVVALLLFLAIWWMLSQLTKPSPKQQAETAKDTAVAYEQAAAGTAAVQAKADEGRATVAAVTEKVNRSATQARAAPAGRTTLPADTVARLRDGDQFLCQSRSAFCEDGGGVRPAPD